MSDWLIPVIFVFYLIYLTMTKPKTKSEKPVAAKTQAEKPVTSPPINAAPEKIEKEQQAPVKSQVKVAKPAAKPTAPPPEIAVAERVGLTAGSIWNFLDKNGATSVAKLVKSLPEEEKIIQRSIGWLAQEGKITLNVIDRVETIALKKS